MKLTIPDFAWLDKLNTTALTVLAYLGLLGLTGLVWAVCTLAGIEMDAGSFGTWGGMLAAIGAIVAYTQQKYRTTDYGYQERQAKIEEAKAQQAAPQQTVNMQGGQANLSGEAKP